MVFLELNHKPRYPETNSENVENWRILLWKRPFLGILGLCSAKMLLVLGRLHKKAAGEYFRSWSDIGLKTHKIIRFMSLGVYLDNNPRFSGIDFWSIRIYLMNSVQSLPRSLLAFVKSPKSGDFGRISRAAKSSEEQGSLVPSKYTSLWYPLQKNKRFFAPEK